MSDLRIVSFMQMRKWCRFHLNNLETDCGLKDDAEWACDEFKCPIWNLLPDARPIVEAAQKHWLGSRNYVGCMSTNEETRMDNLKATLDAVKKLEDSNG